ncbi:ketopantoate reductase family protein [Reyranella sp.]|uniref:ketopantoate reductase family protein n=2 Tax=Reyranella sp. TaxID=1929291 RepID=UPI003D0EB338
MRVLVVGAGAIGGYFGGRLAEVGRDVSFLVRPTRAEHLARHGLQIVSQHGDACVRVRTLQAGQIKELYDVVLIATKAYGLDQAIVDFGPAVGDHTVILPLLNGMRHMDVLSTHFGPQRLLGGLCSIAATMDREGRVVQSTVPVHEIVIGELGGTTERVERIAELFKGAKCDARVSKTIVLDMWEKWTWLATLAGITCLMRASVGDIVAAPGGCAATLALLDEVTRVASAYGYQPRHEYLAYIRSLLTREGSPLTASMFRDIERGAEAEGEHVLGDLGSDA